MDTAQSETFVAAFVDRLSKDERSLLLFLETAAVDRGGLVIGEHMNHVDFDIARGWARNLFVRFSRIISHLMEEAKLARASHVVELSPFAWQCAALERCRRAARSQRREIVQTSLDHFERPAEQPRGGRDARASE